MHINPVKKKKQKERKHFTEKWKNKKNNVRELVRIYYYNYPCNTGEDRKSLSSYKKILLWFFYLTYRSRLDIIPFTGEGKLLDIGWWKWTISFSPAKARLANLWHRTKPEFIRICKN